jgi:hypothetical protein
VRIGNAAYQQNQHDVWGVVLDSVYLHTKSRDRLDERVWKLAASKWSVLWSAGVSPTRASGKSAASLSTSPPRR